MIILSGLSWAKKIGIFILGTLTLMAVDSMPFFLRGKEKQGKREFRFIPELFTFI